MQTITTLKKDIEFNKGLTSLIEALKNIAVSQYRALEHKLKTFEEFKAHVESFFEFVNCENLSHPFIFPSLQKQAVIAVTSDSGLLGGLNMQVINKAMNELEKIPGQLIVIGERGKAYAADSSVPFVAFSGIKDEERMAQAIQLRDYVMDKVFKREFGYLKVVYPHPVSFTVQRIEVISFIPFVPPPEAKLATKQEYVDIILESKIKDIIDYLVFLWIGQKLFEIFGLSRLAEFAARYVHLEESLQKLKEMDTKLRLQYFRARHEIIDRNMRELFSARLLYAGS